MSTALDSRVSRFLSASKGFFQATSVQREQAIGVILAIAGDASMSEQPASRSQDDPDGLEDFGRKGMEFADASLWLSRIFSAIVPGLIGLWLDHRFGTRYWALLGLVLGLTSGILHFIQATRGVFSKPVSKSTSAPSQGSKSSPGRKLR